MAKSNTFFLLSMLVVLLNSVWIGLEADADQGDMGTLTAEQMAVEHIFCVAFTSEIAALLALKRMETYRAPIR